MQRLEAIEGTLVYSDLPAREVDSGRRRRALICAERATRHSACGGWREKKVESAIASQTSPDRPLPSTLYHFSVVLLGPFVHVFQYLSQGFIIFKLRVQTGSTLFAGRTRDDPLRLRCSLRQRLSTSTKPQFFTRRPHSIRPGPWSSCSRFFFFFFFFLHQRLRLVSIPLAFVKPLNHTAFTLIIDSSPIRCVTPIPMSKKSSRFVPLLQYMLRLLNSIYIW